MDESATPAREWHDFCSLEEIPDGGILTRLQGGEDLLVYRNGPQVTCMPTTVRIAGGRSTGDMCETVS
jgi:hypothetical protein